MARCLRTSQRRNDIKERSSMKRLFAGSENAPPVARWWARGAGIGLAALFIVAEIQALGLGLNALWMSVVLVIVIAFFWKGLDGVTFVRWWARTVSVGQGVLLGTILIGVSVGGYGPGIWTFVAWAIVFVGIVIAFFWEGIGGAIVALAALGIQAEVIMSEGSGIYGLDPAILVFVFAGLASYYCWWRTLRLSLTHQPA
jgi:hypothetical protein